MLAMGRGVTLHHISNFPKHLLTFHEWRTVSSQGHPPSLLPLEGCQGGEEEVKGHRLAMVLSQVRAGTGMVEHTGGGACLLGQGELDFRYTGLETTRRQRESHETISKKGISAWKDFSFCDFSFSPSSQGHRKHAYSSF